MADTMGAGAACLNGREAVQEGLESAATSDHNIDTLIESPNLPDGTMCQRASEHQWGDLEREVAMVPGVVGESQAMRAQINDTS